MKRIFFVGSLVLLTSVGSFLSAQEGYGYLGPGAELVTIESAKRLRNDYPVTVKGRIERFLGDEKYLFSDETGSIVIEIDDRLWRGISVGQNDTVEISGELDRNFNRTEIEASNIKKF